MNRDLKMLLNAEGAAIDSYCKVLEIKNSINTLTTSVIVGSDPAFNDIRKSLETFVDAHAQFLNVARDLLETIQKINLQDFE